MEGWPKTAEDEESWYPHYVDAKPPRRVTWPVAFFVVALTLAIGGLLMKYGLTER